MSEANIPPGKAPRLILVRIRTIRWPNLGSAGSPLVDPAYLTPLNCALDDCLAFIRKCSIPTFRDDERVVPASARNSEVWLFPASPPGQMEAPPALGFRYTYVHYDHGREASAVFGALAEEWARLGRSWASLLPETPCSGNEPIPEPGSMWKHFAVWGEVSDTPALDTHQFLGKFSIFEPPPLRPPDIFEAIDFGRKLEQLYEERRSGKITEEQFQKSAGELIRTPPQRG